GVRTHAGFGYGRASQDGRHRGHRRFCRAGALPWSEGTIAAVEVHEEAPMEDAPVLVERRAGYRVIMLNRPRQLNAVNEAMQQALKRALAEAEEDCDCRALLLTGAGRAFCAGQDLRERMTADGKTTVLGSTLDTYYNPLVRKLRTLPFPVVAAVNGVAPSRAWRPAPPPISRSPATSGGRRARRASCRPSPRSASPPIAGAPGSCRGWSAPPAPAGLRLRPSRSPRTRPKPGASFGKRS